MARGCRPDQAGKEGSGRKVRKAGAVVQAEARKRNPLKAAEILGILRIVKNSLIGAKLLWLCASGG
jgi:hypothetical protein